MRQLCRQHDHSRRQSLRQHVQCHQRQASGAASYDRHGANRWKWDRTVQKCQATLFSLHEQKWDIFFISHDFQNDIKTFKLNHLAYIEERGLTPLQDIHESMGGWPVVKGDAWEEKLWTWQQSVKEFRKRGYSTDYIFDFSVGTDLKNSTRRIIDVSWSDSESLIR